ncbi:uncharacterized protein B0H18DRAFT_1075869, partial [Fomitopsis serialis]|uniref:uncharacterized protein n=1 Tax=Fomitopsis serialis TaxID=139415 RepID=UPI0020084672
WFGVHLILTKADGYTNVPKRTEIILIVVGSIFTLMALTSFFGFIGSITRNRRFVKSYSFMSIFLFIGSLVSAALFLYTLYSEKNITTSCIVNENGAVKIDDCDTHVSTAGKIVATVIVAVEILVHLCESPFLCELWGLLMQAQTSWWSSGGTSSSSRTSPTSGRARTSSPRPTSTRASCSPKRPTRTATPPTPMARHERVSFYSRPSACALQADGLEDCRTAGRGAVCYAPAVHTRAHPARRHALPHALFILLLAVALTYPLDFRTERKTPGTCSRLWLRLRFRVVTREGKWPEGESAEETGCARDVLGSRRSRHSEDMHWVCTHRVRWCTWRRIRRHRERSTAEIVVS